jgi:hypothetical protein
VHALQDLTFVGVMPVKCTSESDILAEDISNGSAMLMSEDAETLSALATGLLEI